jgi:hypothetical protein
VVKEALCWHPVRLTGVAHSVTEDNFYDSYYILRAPSSCPISGQHTWP